MCLSTVSRLKPATGYVLQKGLDGRGSDLVPPDKGEYVAGVGVLKGQSRLLVGPQTRGRQHVRVFSGVGNTEMEKLDVLLGQRPHLLSVGLLLGVCRGEVVQYAFTRLETPVSTSHQTPAFIVPELVPTEVYCASFRLVNSGISGSAHSLVNSSKAPTEAVSGAVCFTSSMLL